MHRDDLNPPAIVREAECSINDLRDRINESKHEYERRGREYTDLAGDIGKWLSKLKGRIQPGKFKAYCADHIEYHYDHVRRLIRLYETRENSAGALTPGTLERNLKILSEDIPDEGVTENSRLPFQSGSAPAPSKTDREPGDETEYDEIAAKIASKLCDNCKRKGGGQPVKACDKCMGMAARIRAGEEVQDKPKGGSKPGKTQTHEPTNGQPVFDWGDFKSHFGGVRRAVDKLANLPGQVPVAPQFEGLRRRLDELLVEFTKIAEKVTKQKAPEF